MTFQPRLLILESHQHIKDNCWPIETKFHLTTPNDWLVKTYTNCYGYMTNMATMPIYGKNYLNLFFSGTKRPLALELGM